jgi:hypothetical protein
MQWQPIETAPRDNRARLIWVPESRCVFCVAWREADDEAPAGWGVFGGSWRDRIQAPSHWMPLPPPPGADA